MGLIKNLIKLKEQNPELYAKTVPVAYITGVITGVAIGLLIGWVVAG